MFMLIINMMMTLAITFMFLNHPLSLGMILLIQTISVSILTGMMSMNYWFSYMIFLIMIGGMLILFIYMTSVASNEKFKFSLKFMFMIFPFILLLLIMLYDTFFFDIILKNDLLNQKNNQLFYLSLNKFINFPLNYLFFMIITYLLITLIMVVKITDLKSGPLRQMN